MKIETVQLSNCKMTVLELSKDQALRLAQDLIRQVNDIFANGDEFKIEDGHYFKVAINRIQDSTKEAIEYLASMLNILPHDEKYTVLQDLASGDDNAIWHRYNAVRLNYERNGIRR